MFGIFKKKPKHTTQEIFSGLGACAKDIVNAASANTDLEVALKGSGTISAILKTSKQYFNIDAKPNSIFARYLAALQQQDLTKMAEMTRSMADALRQEDDIQRKGALIYFWFVGNE